MKNKTEVLILSNLLYSGLRFYYMKIKKSNLGYINLNRDFIKKVKFEGLSGKKFLGFTEYDVFSIETSFDYNINDHTIYEVRFSDIEDSNILSIIPYFYNLSKEKIEVIHYFSNKLQDVKRVKYEN